MLQKENDGKGKKDVPVMGFDHHRDLNSVLDKTAQGKGMPTKRYVVNLSVEMHDAFKLACLKEGLSMKDVGVALISEWLKARADK
ncbi:MAG: plasmid partition protein ParG [Shewanella sp.]